MLNLGLFLANFGATVILFLVFAACALVAVFAGITLRKKKNAKDAESDGKVTEAEA